MILHHGGFPIRTSPDQLICSSPRLIAACHVLHRLLMPRHSPCALCSLTFVCLLISITVSASSFKCSRTLSTLRAFSPCFLVLELTRLHSYAHLSVSIYLPLLNFALIFGLIKSIINLTKLFTKNFSWLVVFIQTIYYVQFSKNMLCASKSVIWLKHLYSSALLSELHFEIFLVSQN